MVPRIAKRGYSFKGSGLYYLHDKEAMTSERVAWTQTRNVLTDNPELALKVMAWTDINSDYLKERSGGSSAGAKQTKGNVYNTSLAWHPDEKPDKEAMIKAADEYIAHMSLSEHEAVIVAHNDTDHAHLHIILNLVHPETGKVKDPGLDQPRAQKWALEYERKTGKIYCPVREENAQRREQGEKIKHRAQKQGYSEAVTRAYRAADNGKAFARSLKEEGLTLCAARRGAGFVLVDKTGRIQKLAPQLDIDEKGKAKKTAAINKKLADLDRSALPDADKLAARHRAVQKEQGQEQEKTAASDKAKAAARAEYEAQQARIKVLEWGKEQRERLEKAQRIERQRLEGRLKSERQDKEASIRKRWHFHIEQNRQTETALKAELDRGGIRGVLFRLRHGKQAREDIENAKRSRLNAEKRQGEEIGLLDKRDRYHHGKMSQRHKTEQQDLEQDIGTALARGEIPTHEKAQAQKAKAVEKQQSVLPAGLGKMRTQKEIQEAVKKQGWQEEQQDIFSGLKPEFQEGAREAYRQAKAAEIKGHEEQEGQGQKHGPRLGHD